MARFALLPLAWATVAMLGLSACTVAPGAAMPGGATPPAGGGIPGQGGLLGSLPAAGSAGATVGAGATAGGALGTGGLGGGLGATAGAQAGGVIATAPDGSTLTRDNALALVEATDFVFVKLGKGAQLAGKQEQAIQALATAWPTMDLATRQKLGNARAQVGLAMGNWEALGGDNQLAFARDVLTISVGQQASTQLLAQFSAGGQAAASGGGGGDPWAQEAAEKCRNGSYEDQLFYCHGVISPGAPTQ